MKRFGWHIAVMLVGVLAVFCAAAMPAYAAEMASVTFDNVSMAALSKTAGIDSVTVGTSASTLAPEENVLYLPSSNTLVLSYTVNFVPAPAGASAAAQASADVSTAYQGVGDAEPDAVLSPQSGAAAGTVEIPVTAGASGGTVDLGKTAPATDANGRSYWHLIFTCDEAQLHVYVYRSAQIASMYIRTAGGLSQIQADKDYREEGGSVAMVAEGFGATAVYDGTLAEIKGHGNATWLFPKKPYQIKLASKASLVEGAKSSKTWILLANVLDESLVRNTTSYNLAASIGLAHSPKGRPVDLYIDGAYQGSYYLCEKVQVGSSRIDIADLDDANAKANPGVDLSSVQSTVLTDTAGTPFSKLPEVSYSNIASPKDVSGGYLIEMELPQRYADEPTYFKTTRGVAFVVKSPDPASPEEMAYIATFVQDLEDAIYSGDGYNAKGHRYSDYIDEESLAKYYDAQEAVANHDAFASSTYFYKDADKNGVMGRLCAGPIWDCDHTLCSTSFDLSYYRADQIFVASTTRTTTTKPCWIAQILKHPEFAELAKNAYVENGGVEDQVEALISSGVDVYAAEVKSSQQMDDLRWSVYKASGAYPYEQGSWTYINDLGRWSDSIQTVKDFLAKRNPALAASENLGGYQLPSGYYQVSVDGSISGLVEVESNYVYEGKPATVNVLQGEASSYVAEYASGGATVDLPLAKDASTGLYSFPMPAADVVIKQAQIAPTISVDAISAQTYTGLAISPAPVVRNLNGNVLVAGTDYSVSYVNNTDTGIAYAIVIGKGSYSGACSASFLIRKSISWTRLSGEDRYETMKAIVENGYSSVKSKTVVIATGDNFPDALAANSLAGIYGYPLILTSGTELSKQAQIEISRLGATKAYIIGGEMAVSKTVEAQVKAIKGMESVTRVAGEDRCETSLKIFESVSSGTWKDTAIIASGHSFADALSISPYSYACTAPVFLTDASGVLSDDEAAAIKKAGFSNIVIVGGTSVVDETVKTQLGSGFAYTRLGGADRYETSKLIALWECGQKGGLSLSTVGIATGANFPDALAGAAFCGSKKGVLMLVEDSEAGHCCLVDILRSEGSSIRYGYIFGGPSAVPKQLETAIEEIADPA